MVTIKGTDRHLEMEGQQNTNLNSGSNTHESAFELGMLAIIQ